MKSHAGSLLLHFSHYTYYTSVITEPLGHHCHPDSYLNFGPYVMPFGDCHVCVAKLLGVALCVHAVILKWNYFPIFMIQAEKKEYIR